MYPQVIEEWKAYGQLSGDRRESNFGFCDGARISFAGWKGVLTKGIEILQRNARLGTCLVTGLLPRMPTWKTKIRLSSGSTPLIRSAFGC
jgi:hypothetical protein